jgi:hypothetical protein
MESDRMVKGMKFQSFEEKLADARMLYMEAITEGVNEAVNEFILDKDKIALCDDAAMFTIFTLCIKRAEILGDVIELKPLVQHMKALIKVMENELPGMLHAFAAAAKEDQPAEGEVN